MKSLVLLFAFLQTIPAELPDDYTMSLVWKGVPIKFAIGEGRKLLNDLLADLNPSLPRNAYMGTDLKRRLESLRSRGVYASAKFTLAPDSFTPGDLLIASVSLCIPEGEFRTRPCLSVNVINLKLYLVLVFRLSAPNQSFKNTFAAYLVHELIHLDRREMDPNAAQRNSRPEARPVREAEEARAWMQTLKEAVGPLRDKKQPLYEEMAKLDDMGRACKYLLPCPAFERYVAQYLTP